MSVSGNLFEVVPTTIGLHPAHVETVMAKISIHRFVMPSLSTNVCIDRARGVDSTQVKAADRVLRVHAMVIRQFGVAGSDSDLNRVPSTWGVDHHRRHVRIRKVRAETDRHRENRWS